MLTFSALLKASRQLGIYGEERAGALDHLPKKVKGPRSERRRRDAVEKAAEGEMVRRWDEELCDFVYEKRT